MTAQPAKPLQPAAEKNLDPALLAEAIASFNEATSRLKDSHDRLRKRVDELAGELAVKNRELSAKVDEVSALKNYLANILESISDGVLTIGLDRRLVALNEVGSTLLASAGALPPQPAGMPVEEALAGPAREVARLLCRAMEEEKSFPEIELELPSAPDAANASALPGGGRILAVSTSPIRNPAGAVLGAVATFRDNTELRCLEQSLRRRDRLAALGEMAAGVAHEIRNPLGGIDLYASTMRQLLPSDGRAAQLCDKISAAVSSLNRIVEDMLTFTRSREPQRKSVPVAHICGTALDLAASALAAKKIAIEKDFSAAGERVMVDPDLMSRAFLNVILNASQVLPEGGRLSINASLEGEELTRRLRISFADNGPGMPDEVMDKVFNPFFTTRKEGTGLGLAIVHKIAQDHGGSVIVERNRPHGAVFTFDLPAR